MPKYPDVGNEDQAEPSLQQLQDVNHFGPGAVTTATSCSAGTPPPPTDEQLLADLCPPPCSSCSQWEIRALEAVRDDY